MTETEMNRQYKQIKAQYPDAILFFRLGDFYETFGQDAIDTARVLGITLTKRNNGGIGDNEFDAVDALVDHVLHRIAAGTADTDNLDHCSLWRIFEHIDFHDISLKRAVPSW